MFGARRWCLVPTVSSDCYALDVCLLPNEHLIIWIFGSKQIIASRFKINWFSPDLSRLYLFNQSRQYRQSTFSLIIEINYQHPKAVKYQIHHQPVYRHLIRHATTNYKTVWISKCVDRHRSSMRIPHTEAHWYTDSWSQEPSSKVSSRRTHTLSIRSTDELIVYAFRFPWNSNNKTKSVQLDPLRWL